MRGRKKRNTLSYARKKRLKRKKRFFFFLLTLFLAGGITYYIFSSPFFRIKELRVEGKKPLREELTQEILKILKENRGKLVFFVSLPRIVRKIEALPRVKEAQVKIVLPSSLWARVEEREPLFYLKKKGGLFEVDKEGKILGEVEKKKDDLPLLQGEVSSSFLKLTAEILKEAKKNNLFFSTLTPVPSGVCARMGEIKIYLGTHREYLAYLPRLLKEEKKVRYIDLRFEDQIVVGK